MDRDVYQTDTPLLSATCDNEDKTSTTMSVVLASLDDQNGLKTTWTPAVVFRVTVLSVLMLLTLLGNVLVITTILSCAELRKKRANIFILNLAVGDLVVCLVSMPTRVFVMASGQWQFGAVACKLTAYCYTGALAFTNFLLAAMSVDIHQVRVIMYIHVT